MSRAGKIELVRESFLTVLLILCFPLNPLVLTGVLHTATVPTLFIAGCVAWGFGMVLVMAPIILFPHHGKVPRGKSFMHTTRLVDTGIYAIIRHPQYTGGIFAVFLATMLWYPHWLFAVLGIIGSVLLYFGCKAEDLRMIEKFGDTYRDYMFRVPGMNFVSGTMRVLARKRKD